MSHEHQEMIETLRGSRKVDFVRLVLEQHHTLDKIKSMAGRKPDKTDTAFIEKHQAKMDDTFNQVGKWIQQAYPEVTNDKLYKYMTPSDLLEHYDISILITKKVVE
jgi:hypothetical protein